MQELTWNNHFQFGYNGQWFNRRSSLEDEFQVRYGKCERAPGLFLDECVFVAKRISDANPGPISIFYSGGADSEAVVRSFMLAKKPFQLVTIRFKDGLNSQDIAFVEKFANRYGLNPIFLDLDILRFFKSGKAWDYAIETQCSTPQLLHHMWGMDQVEGFSILGSGECYLRKLELENPNSAWVLHERDKIASWYRYFLVRNRKGCPGFFQYTPELMLSWLLDPIAVDLINNRIYGKKSSISSKLLIYKKHFGEMLETPTFGYGGFEHLMEIDRQMRPKLVKKFGKAEVLIPYAELVASLKANNRVDH